MFGWNGNLIKERNTEGMREERCGVGRKGMKVGRTGPGEKCEV